jgi:hypothetical protein
MSSSVVEVTQRDPLALEIAAAIAIANPEVVARGKAPQDLRISVVKDVFEEKELWSVHYGPRNYVRTRGGSLTVYVDVDAGAVVKVLFEQ